MNIENNNNIIVLNKSRWGIVFEDVYKLIVLGFFILILFNDYSYNDISSFKGIDYIMFFHEFYNIILNLRFFIITTLLLIFLYKFFLGRYYWYKIYLIDTNVLHDIIINYDFISCNNNIFIVKSKHKIDLMCWIKNFKFIE